MQGLHTTGDSMGKWKKNSWMGFRVVDWPASGRVGIENNIAQACKKTNRWESNLAKVTRFPN